MFDNLPFTLSSLRSAYADGASPVAVVEEVYRRIAEVDDPGIFIALFSQAEVLEAAAALGDFLVAFYNPVSRKRDWQLGRAKELLLEKRPGTTPVILGRNLSRADEQVTITTLAELDPAQVDMLTLVLIGSSDSRRINDWVYTPRGYSRKLDAI